MNADFPQEVWDNELTSIPKPTDAWLWHRFLSGGNVTLLTAPPKCGNAAAWLVVSDPPQPSAAIVVLGGKVPFRAMEGASLYKQGWAREVWLTNQWTAGGSIFNSGDRTWNWEAKP